MARQTKDFEQIAGGGCGLLLAAGIIWALIGVSNFLHSCGAPPERTAEQNIQAAADEKAEADRLAAFNAEQTPLWTTPSAKINADRLIKEMGKCEAAIRAASNSPYQMLFDDYDTGKMVDRIKAGETDISITSQQREELLNKVRIVSSTCHFRGVGFTDFDEGHDAQFSDDYIRN